MDIYKKLLVLIILILCFGCNKDPVSPEIDIDNKQQQTTISTTTTTVYYYNPRNPYQRSTIPSVWRR